jgi:hypothetical protein
MTLSIFGSYCLMEIFRNTDNLSIDKSAILQMNMKQQGQTAVPTYGLYL